MSPAGNILNSSFVNTFNVTIANIYIITATSIAIIVANLSIIIPFKVKYVKYEHIPIMVVANIGFITNFENVKFNFIFFRNAVIAIQNATAWQATEPIAAPYTPNSGFGISVIFKMNLTNTPVASDIVGIISFPYPCNIPFIVWSNIVNIIAIALICNIKAPSFAFGNNKFSIGCANINIPIVHGSPINIDTNSENVAFSVIVLLSFLALAADIAGTSAVAKATFMANGNVVSVSTFPPNIPYNDVAVSSGMNFFRFLTTVNESTFLFIDDIIAVSVIAVLPQAHIQE